MANIEGTFENDTLNGGNDDDLVVGNGGDDTIQASGGNDTVFGDSGGASALTREGFEWTGVTGSQIDHGFVQNTGTIDVTYSRIVDTGHHSSDASNAHLNVAGIDTGGEPIDNCSSLSSETGSQGSVGAFQWEFSDAVSDVSFNVNDLDGDGVVNIKAFDADGNEIPVTLTGGHDVTLSDTDSVAGNDTAISDGGYSHPDDPDYTLNVSIAGPVARIVLEHTQDGYTNSGINVTGIYFDAGGDVGEDGDDVIDGGDGDDLLFGEGGDDTIDGGDGNDVIYGDSGTSSTGGKTEIGIADEGGSATLLVWDASQLSYSGGNPFPDGTSGLSDSSVNGITMTINAGATPVAVGIQDGSSSEFNDGDSTQNLVNNETIDGETGNAGDRFTPEYSYSVQNVETGDIINVYAVEVNGNEIVGFVSDAPMEVGATYTFLDNTSTYPSVPYQDLADTYFVPDSSAESGGFADDGNDGDDVIDGGSGDDTIFGQGGSDTIDGGDGNDLIYGDFGPDANNTVLGTPTTLDISQFSGSEIVSANGALTADVSLGGFIKTTSSSTFGKATPDNVLYSGPEVGGSSNQLDISFDNSAADVSFTIYDVNQGGGWDDQIQVIALDADGNEVPVTFSGSNVNSNGVDVRGNTIDANDSNSNYRLDDSNADNVQVSIEGPIASLTIIHEPGNDSSGTIGWIGIGDISATPVAESGTGGSGADESGDIIDGGEGDDTIFGEGGNDTIDGGDGNDLIYGDSGDATSSVRESFSWEGLNDSQIDDGFVQDTGNVTVTYDRTIDTGAHLSERASDDLNVSGIDSGGAPIDSDNSLRSVTNGEGNVGEFKWDFSNPVSDVSFNINDIDNDGVVQVKAFDADGNQIPVELVAGSNITLLDNDGVAGSDTADSDGGIDEPVSAEYNLNVSIAGPVASIVVTHTQDGGGNSGILITEMFFDAPVDGVDGDSGDDVITGGDGADTIFGEAGSDTILGGNDGDVVDGGTEGSDVDVLDLRGEGPARIVNETTDEDGDSTSGTVEFLDSDGNVTGTLDFSEIESILLDPVDQSPDAVDDALTIDEDASPVTINVLANDTDPQNDPLSITDASVPADQGTVDIIGNQLVFTPAPDFNGDATISYTIEDSDGNSDSAEVSVTVAPVNDAPDAVNDLDSTPEETPVTIDVLGNDTDVDGDTLSITGASVPDDQGTVEIVDDELVFTPAENFNGIATISYSIEDGNGGTDTAIVEVDVTPVNDDPVAVDDAIETDEDVPVVIDLIGNDTDVDGDPLSIGEVSVDPALGTVEDNGDGTVTFTPAPDYNGPVTIDYTVVDGQGGEDEGQAVVNVGSVNDGPTANDDSDTTDEDTPITVDLIGNDTDPDGDPLSVTGASVPSDQGTLVDNGDGTVTFTPAPDFNGEATIDYSITDGDGGTSSATHVITVTPVNDDPVAVDDIVTTDEDVPVVIDLIGNDTDVDGDPLSIGEVSVDPALGTVEDNGDGTVTFTPAPDYNGPVTIDYTVVDGQGGEDEGQAVVSVGAVNDAPVAVDDTASTPEDTPVTIDVLGDDTDPDGDPLTVISATVPEDQGTVEIVDDELVFTPAPDFNGPATITYTISDGNGGTDTGEVAVDVTPQGDGPVTGDDVAETDEDTPVTIDVLSNDEDPDGQPLTVTEATSPDGTVTINPDGTLTFEPDPDFNGPTTISYTVEDPDGNESPGTVSVTVAPVNDAPDAVNDLDSTPEETPVTIDVLGNDTDVDGDTLSITGASVPDDQGTVEIVDDELVFTPAENFNGIATISYSIEDGNGGTDTAIVEVDVTPVNDDPVAVDDAIETDEDVPVVIDLIGNDTDVDGDPLSIGEVSVDPALGTVEDNGDGTVTFTPAPDYNGPVTIDYTVVDGQGGEDEGQAVVNVGSVNDGPTANDDSDTTDEDTPITVDLIGNDTDPDGDPLSVTGASVPSDQGTLVDNGDGTVTFTPAPDFNGEATIDYSITDGDGGTSSATHVITVTPVNDDPVAVDDIVTTDEDVPVVIDLIGNDTDVDGDPLSIGEVSVDPALGTVEDNGDGTVTFTPAPDYNGPVTIDYTVVDGQGGEDEGQAVVSVGAVNDAPVAVDDTASTPEDTPVTIDVLGDDTDPDGDPLTVISATVPEDQGTVEIVDDELVFTPAPDFNGPATITYTISDGNGGTDTGEVAVDVTPQGDGPVTGDDVAETDEDTPVTIDVLSNDEDPDGQPLTVTEATSPDGTVTINPDGTLTFEPDPDFNGPTTISYTVEDPDGNESPGTVSVTVAPVNDAPDAVNDLDSTPEETPVTIDVLGNDTDVDGDTLSITGASVPDDQGTVEIVDDELVFTPAENFNGIATISYSIEDGNGGTDTAIVEVDVTPVNDDPVAVDDAIETDEDVPVVIDLIGNDTDVDGDPLSIGEVSVDPALGTVEDNGDGTVTFTPAPDYNGPVTIDYTVVDGQGGEDEGQAVVNVGSVNDGPTANDDSDTTDEDTPITVDLIGNDTDPDGDPLSVTGASVPSDQGTLVDNGDGTVTFTPAPDFNGEATIDYSITDGDGGTSSATHVITVTPVNDDPVAVDDIVTTDEDVPVVIDLIGNDTDVDGDPLSIGEVSVDPALGTVEDNGDGTVTFTPAPDYNGPVTIDYTVVDGQGGEDEGQAVVSVGAVNDAPVAVDDTASTPEDTPVTIDVLGDDTDPDGDPLTVISATVPEDQGTVEIVDDELVFTPAPDFNGPATITYTISDGNGGTDTGEVAVDVTPQGDGPVTGDDVAETDEDTPVTIDVLSNDEDPDGQPLTVTEATSPDGTVTINPDGTLTFEPDPDFNGPTTISYTVEDPDGNESPGTVSVTVAPVNDAPDAVNDLDSTPEETPVTIDVLGNDTDVDGDTLSITGASVPDDQGTVEIVDDELVFTPAENFNGIATISYSIEDGNGGTDTAIVEVDVTPVNDDPVAVDDAIETDEDVPVVIDLIGNDTDVDGDPLSIGEVSVDPALGTVEDNGDGTVTFTPAPDYNGPVTIDYTVVDGQGGEDEGQAVVNVGSVNDGPTANDDSDTTDEDTPITVDLIGNDTDPDGDPLSVTGASVPSDQGTLVDNGDGTVTFTPAPDFNGEATIDYSITDGDGGTSSATHVITVTPVNDDPVAVDDIVTTDEDVPVVIDLIGNDTDVDGDPLSIGEVSVDPALGTVEDNGDGTVTFTPAPDYNGPVTIDYTVVDGQGGEDEGQAVVSVGAVNDAPVAVDDTASTPEDTPVTIDVLGDDTDPDGDPLTVISATVPEDQGTVEIVDDELVFTPAPDFNGPATITYTISDGNGGTDTGEVAVDVTPQGDGPVTGDDVAETDEDTPVTIDVLSNDEDPDGQPLTVTEATSPDGTVTINPDGTLTFEPDPDFNGPTTISYTVEDPDGNESPGTVSVTVAPVNDAPDAVDDVATTPFDTPVIIPVLSNDTDVDGDTPVVVSATSPDGNVVVNPDGTITFTPLPGFEGPATISYTIEDPDGLQDTAQVVVAVGDQPLDGIVEGTEEGELIDEDYLGDPEGDRVDNGDNIFSNDPEKEDDDIIEAGGGNDTVISGDGSDSVDGGDGDDVIDTDNGSFLIDKGYPGAFEGEEGTDAVFDDRDTVLGGAGNDTIRTGDDEDQIFGGEGNDVIDGGIDDDLIEGNEGNDRIVGGEGEDTIFGGDGDDLIYAGNDPVLGLDNFNIEDDGSNPTFGADLRPDNGRDSVFGGDGNDTIFGADDADELFGDDGDDVLDGEIDDDTLTGGAGEDELIGGQGEDSLLGGTGDDTLTGGEDADDMSGGADRDLFVVDDAEDGNGDVVDGGEEGDDFDTLDLTGSGPLNIIYTSPDEEDGIVQFLDGVGGPVKGTLTFTEIENIVPCFTPGTSIATPRGEMLIEDLRVGDKVITRDNGMQEIRWIGTKHIDGYQLRSEPHMQPVLIQKGSLGHDLPERDMLVSPNHRMLVSNDRVSLYFEEDEVLVAAKHLINPEEGVQNIQAMGVSYVHMMFDNHEVVLANGAWTESFQPGDYSLKGIGNAQRNEIFELFPELRGRDGQEAYSSARLILKKHEARMLFK